MKRRKFIKTTTVSSIALSTMGLAGFSATKEQKPLSINQSLLLTGLNEEQEENPSLVTDGSDEMWMFALRRISYPENAELISAFHFDGINWKETDAVTRLAAEYEAHVAACATGGKPVVAWTEKKEEDWVINVAMMKADGISDPYLFPVKSGRSINPVLIAPDKNRNWIAWENLKNGKFTIYISKYENAQWSEAVIIDKGENSCFDPCIAEAGNGDLFIAYGFCDGFHQNIEMSIIDGATLQIKESLPVAIGGGHKDRVNINARPALAFDATDRLWISFENNRDATRLDDGDNYTGDRCCAILSYQDGKIVEIANQGKWLFKGKNDQKPSFIKDRQGHLYLATHCGGNFADNPHWQYRLSWLDPQKGWVQPVTILDSSQKGAMIPPAVAFDKNNKLWLATCFEKRFEGNESEKPDDVVRARLTELSVQQFSSPQLNDNYTSISFRETMVREFLPDEKSISNLSGHTKVAGEQITVDGDVYTLIYGNLHEHSENSPCWPAGTDGTLHDNYRFGMYSEGYDFVAITDHGYSMNEVYWRKNLRLADFYNEPDHFVAIPAMEWTLRSDPDIDGIQHGAGHYNVIFPSADESRKFIRNQYEIYSVYCPETNNSSMLWNFLHEKNIDCVTIPHHPADETHPVDWDVHDEKYVPVVEMFQCRGNAEYPGCPREINLQRHRTSVHKRAFVNYALIEKKYKMGFIASGDHNSMGIGVAAFWVKELSREGIIEAMRSRRCFATTGDKMIVDFRINKGIAGSTIKTADVPNLSIKIKGERELEKVEIIRNSKVIHQFDLDEGVLNFAETFSDQSYQNEKEVLYYYIRASQKNKALAWSSPIWVERT